MSLDGHDKLCGIRRQHSLCVFMVVKTRTVDEYNSLKSGLPTTTQRLLAGIIWNTYLSLEVIKSEFHKDC